MNLATNDTLTLLTREDTELRFAAFEHDDAIGVGQRVIELARQRELTIS
ncbi:hypothetical protein IAE22_33325, partial [Bacillus sp. S34]|nr:hypothetical protein [Bacillus sp. S34]